MAEFNKKLAASITYASLLLGIGWALFIIYKPRTAFSFADKADIKALLIFLGIALIGFLGLTLYRIKHTPHPLRYILFFSRTTAFVGFLGSVAPPSLVALQKLRLSLGGEMVLDLSFSEAAYVSAVTFGLTIVGLALFTHYYFQVFRYEKEHGPLTA